ncbi:MAG: DUF4340 domain-containing protein [bacterium]|nr:DUF4340 domain-containing protein [bacterium]
MTRAQKLLGGFLLLQIVVILLVRSPFGSADASSSTRPLAEGLDAFAATRVELSEPDRRVTLVKQGDDWTIEELDGMPADGTKIGELVDDLRGVRVRRPVVTSKRYHDKFKVADDDHEARVRVWGDGDEDPRLDVYIGTAVNYRASHVRLEGEAEVYEARDVAGYDVNPDASNWCDKDLIDVPEARLVALDLVNAQGRFELERIDGTWHVKAPESARGRVLDSTKVGSLLRSARTIRIAEPQGRTDEAAQGLADPTARLTLHVASVDNPDVVETVEVLVGDRPEGEEMQRYVTRDGYGFSGTIWESSIQSLLDQKLDELFGES